MERQYDDFRRGLFLHPGRRGLCLRAVDLASGLYRGTARRLQDGDRYAGRGGGAVHQADRRSGLPAHSSGIDQRDDIEGAG